MILNIAMDGPVGAGKSSIARAVADRLGILHLDTGAMYRAVGLSAIRAGVDLQDEAAVTAHTRAIDVAVAHSENGQRTIVNGEDLTDYIRTPEVSMAASTVGRYQGVETGVASVEDIDKAMQLGANHPMGPLALGDFIGLDVCLAIMDTLYSETGDGKYRASLLLRKMVRGGILGKKSGKGFYDYSK